MNHLWGWVNEFFETFEIDPAAERDTAWSRLREEVMEVKAALEDGDRALIAQELADVVYTCYGIGLALEIRMDPAVAAVHASNMSKIGLSGRPLKEDGKVLKGPGYKPPDMRPALRPLQRLPE